MEIDRVQQRLSQIHYSRAIAIRQSGLLDPDLAAAATARLRRRSRSRGAAAQRILQLRLLLVACGTVSLSSRRLSDTFDVNFKDCFDVAVRGDW